MEYLNSIKAAADELGLIDAAVSADDLTLYIIKGLGPAYRELVSAICTRETPFRYEELRDRLLEHEIYLKQVQTESAQLVATAHMAQSQSLSSSRSGNNSSNRSSGGPRGNYRGRGGRGRNNGRNSGRDSTRNNHFSGNDSYHLIFCQLCGYQGHTAPYSCCSEPYICSRIYQG